MKKYLLSDSQSHMVPESAPELISMTSATDFQGADLNIISHARAGIKVGYLLELGEVLGLSQLDLCKILHISLGTLQRYHSDLVLDADASSKVIQLTILRQRGLIVFGNQSGFNHWLKAPMSSLEGKPPLDYLDTPFGFQLIFQILGRIEHGVFA
ncbi:MAG: DUF2384 domain-containing protein [Saprospiraceae bacterium]|nr:DUF2384 domain-containing protein [Saprospiraceae bacterium]